MSDLWWRNIPKNFFSHREGRDPIHTFLDHLPNHVREQILKLLPHYRIRTMFINEILANEDNFTLTAAYDELQATNKFWKIRKDIYYLTPDGEVVLDYRNKIFGGGWLERVLGDEDFGPQAPEGYEPLWYARGTRVKLWWIRMRDNPAPFYLMTEQEFGWYCTQEVVWGAGPDHRVMAEFAQSEEGHDQFNRDEFVIYASRNVTKKKKTLIPPTKNISELEFRKNACCKTIRGCNCGNMLRGSHHLWVF